MLSIHRFQSIAFYDVDIKDLRLKSLGTQRCGMDPVGLGFKFYLICVERSVFWLVYDVWSNYVVVVRRLTWGSGHTVPRVVSQR